MKKSASKQRFLAAEELCPPSPCTPRFLISSSQRFPRKYLQRLISAAQQNFSASTYPSQPLAFSFFTTQVPAFTIFTPKKFSRSILLFFISFPPAKIPRSVNKSTQVPAISDFFHQNSINEPPRTSSVVPSGTEFIDCRPLFPFVERSPRDFHASKTPHSALCILHFAFIKPAWYR